MFDGGPERRAPIRAPAAFLLKQAPVPPKRREQSWPLEEQGVHFDLGHVLNCAITDTIEPAGPGSLTVHHAGLWECELATGRLIWSGGVYDMFGLERRLPIDRERALALYTDRSRAALEQLRAYAIAERRGFTLDVEIRPEAVAEARWMRIIAAPVIEDGSVTRLHGIKLAI